MYNSSFSRRCAWLPVALLTGMVACGTADPVGSAGGTTALSLSVASAGVTATNASGSAIIVGSSADTLVLTKVELVLNDVELRRAGVTTCPDGIVPRVSGERSSDSEGCSRLDLGPMLLEVPLNSAGSSKLAVAIPAGSYRELEFELDKVQVGSSATPAERAFLTQYPDLRDVTVRVTGTYRGAPFTFLSRVEAEVEFEFDPALLVEAGVNDNITISLDLGRWFRDSNGAVLAPSAGNQGRIEQNIVTSFDAFGDRDRDGREDRGRSRERSRQRTP